MVFATCTPNRKKAAKFQKAAHKTAAVGDKTLVETIVAMEFAASFIPLRKSNRRAKTIAIITIVNMTATLHLFNNNRPDAVTYVFSPVCSILKTLNYVFVFD